MDVPLGVVKFCYPFDYCFFDYIVKDNAQKIYLVPTPALEKGKASQEGNIKSLQSPLLETERRDIHQKTVFSECACCALSSKLPSMCCGKRKRTLLLPKAEHCESVKSPTTSWDVQPCSGNAE